MAVLATETWTGTTGAAWPAQWTTEIVAPGVVNIDTNRGRLSSTNATTYARGDRATLNSVAARRDWDVTVDVTFPVIAEMYAAISLRASPASLGGASFEPDSAYGVVIYPGNGVNSMGFMEWTGGNAFNLSVPADLPAGQWVANVAKRVRVYAVGDSMKTKVWDPAGAEPAAWLWEGTDTSYSANLGVLSMQIGNGNTATARTVYLDNMVVTDGADGVTIGKYPPRNRARLIRAHNF